ncbi:MAG: RNA-binding transcriptional accessory protein [Peptococcaceae bacterium]|jgi:uncharacterized protein|nr:RNA-binding transcriptional accessory protein [Peptococcaceae bacterium]
MNIAKALAKEFQCREIHAQNIIELIEDGNTIPFIARYRKEMTGSCDDQTLRQFGIRLEYLTNLEKRKAEIKAAIEEQGKLTPALIADIDGAETLARLEDIYRPYRAKRRTRAGIAREKGLEPLARIIVAQTLTQGDLWTIAQEYIDPEKGVATAQEAVEGAKDIIAEDISDDAALRATLRQLFWASGRVICAAATGKAAGDTADADNTADAAAKNTAGSAARKAAAGAGDPGEVYAQYFAYEEPAVKLPSHRILAINRGEKEGFLKVDLAVDEELARFRIEEAWIRGESVTRPAMEEAAWDSFKRLIQPSLRREIRNELTDKAAGQAINNFGLNLKHLLLQPPLKGKVVIGFDPAYRTGCKLAVVDATGKVLDTQVIYPTPPQKREAEAKETLRELIFRHKVDVIAIGNGTASKESEIFVAGLIREISRPVSYIMVNEAGASVYSASPLAAKEFPEFDVTLRGAASIARRLQDPLAELVKIDPKSIGVGQYQHDMPEKELGKALQGVVEDCVNQVGVDLNTASPSLLTYVAGLSGATADNVVRYRESRGAFSNRRQLREVPKLGPKAFQQCAGFLRIPGADQVLDNTSVHPESYAAAEKLLALFQFSTLDVGKEELSALPAKIKGQGEEKVAAAIGVGVPTLRDMTAELLQPGRDLRDQLPPPVLRADIMSMEDLRPGMTLPGTVRNVVDFGIFVDIGVHQDGLVHISQAANRYIRHPSEVAKVGDQINVTVLAVEPGKKRISLSMRNHNTATAEAGIKN